VPVDFKSSPGIDKMSKFSQSNGVFIKILECANVKKILHKFVQSKYWFERFH